MRSLKDRLRARMRVSVAEVGDVESWQIANLGVAVVARERPRCDEALAQAISIARSLPEAVVTDVRSEVQSFGRAGETLRDGIESLADEDDSP